MNCKHWLALVGWVGAVCSAAQTTDETWRRGTELQRALSAPVTLQSSQESLREFFIRLGKSQQVAFFLDRRIDPSQPRDFAQPSRSLQSVITLAVAPAGAYATPWGDLIYVGPAEVAASLPDALQDLKAQVKSLPAGPRKTWQKSQALSVPRLGRPAELLDQLAAENGVTIEGLEQVSFDVWPEIRTPPLSLADRFAVLLIGFGLWPEISRDGMSVRLVEFAVPPEITRTYTCQKSQELDRWAEDHLPSAKIAAKKGSATVTAAPANHQQIAVWVAQNEPAPASSDQAGTQKVVSLHATASAGAITRQVAAQLGVDYQCDPQSEKLLEKRVTIDVDRVSYPELLRKVLAETGLSFQLDERQLRIFPQ